MALLMRDLLETYGVELNIESNYDYTLSKNQSHYTSQQICSITLDSIWWYGWKALSLSFPKLFADWKSVEY